MGAPWAVLLAIVLVGSCGCAAAQESSDWGDASARKWSEFALLRGIYRGISDHDPWGPRWRMDYPDADDHFLRSLRRLSVVDAASKPEAIPIAAERVFEQPFVYLVEIGALELSETQKQRLRAYLLAGGFLVVDDFWGSWAWRNTEQQMRELFPERSIVDIPLEHPLFNAFYKIDSVLQVPNVRQAGSGRTHEFDGRTPRVRGIFDSSGRLMILFNFNTDLGDAWEWADEPSYPLRFSNFAFRMGVNFAVYAMSY